jgi:hypothetical protein
MDGGERDVDCLAGIEPLELLLAIPHIIVVTTAVTDPSARVLGLVAAVLTAKVKNEGSSYASVFMYPPRRFAPRTFVLHFCCKYCCP